MPIPLLPAGNDLNNREISVALWLVVLSVYVSTKTDVRRSAVAVLKSLLQRPLVLSLAGVVAWIVLVTVIGWHLGLWGDRLVKDTVLWALTFGVVRLFGMSDLQRDPHFFRNVILDPLKATAIFEFVENLYVFPLPVEIILVPFVTVLAMLAVYASHSEVGPVKGVVNGVLAIVGVVILTFSIWKIVASWSRLDVWRDIQLFALPIWLALGLVPYLYLMSLLAGYESTFLRVAFATPGRRISVQSRLALLSVLHVQARPVAGFRAPWIGQLAETRTLREGRTVVKDYLANFRRPMPATEN